MSLTKSRYPTVLQALMDYEQHVDLLGDDEFEANRALQRRLEEFTEKDLSSYNLWEWWEEEGIEVLAFRVALPDPPCLKRRLRYDELAEIVRCLFGNEEAADEFAKRFSIYLCDRYHGLLKLNAPFYCYTWFLRKKRTRSVARV